MPKTLLVLSTVSVLVLTGCSAGDLATAAADAAACRALEATIETTANAYSEGLVDSGVIQQVDDLVGDQVRSLLSTGLAQDLKEFVSVVDSSDPAQNTKEKVTELTDSIAERCAAVGVNFTN
jgi:ABC-type phosphate/phosphonate transport system substrate-binding protein